MKNLRQLFGWFAYSTPAKICLRLEIRLSSSSKSFSLFPSWQTVGARLPLGWVMMLLLVVLSNRACVQAHHSKLQTHIHKYIILYTYVYHRRAMSGYVVRQTPKKVSSQKTAGFAEKLVWHVWKKKTNAERQAQLNTNHWIHSQRSAHLFIKALGQSLRFVRWRPGVSGMSSPVHPMPSPIC